MGSKKLYDEYYIEINSLVDMLGKYVNAYRLLIGSAGELNSIALSKKSDVKDALKRIDDVGELIDNIVDALECSQCNYIEYLRFKSKMLNIEVSKAIIQTEIDNELNFQNEREDE
ncbi:hypothetical protein [uncultured Clostridium sp.]|uniref:hypothetical protein n=1 Tax=uncultured Clostridium sp. TaxID=59620 RepID=UPI00262BC3D8|nr:hypothetical protein [uncultured Clostridium sp.]